MATDSLDPTSHHPMSPPTDPGEMGSSALPPAWHKPIGIIAIVFGSLGALGGSLGLFGPQIMELMASIAPQETAGQFEVMESFAGWTIAFSLVGLAVAIVLLVGGIGVVRRRRQGVTMICAWAVVKMLLVVATSVLQYQVFQETAVAMTRTPRTPAMPSGVYEVMGVASTGMTLVWGWALPVFMLIWFARRRIKHDVSAWS